MKLTTNLKALTAAAILAVPAMAPTTASAELGYNASVASMYLWRGQDVSLGPAVSGGIDFSDESGLYASTWVSSGRTDDEVVGGGYEHDIWFGFAGEAGDISYDVSYWYIDYPLTAGDPGDEIALSVGFKQFSLGIVSGDDGYMYTTLGAEFGPASVTYGMSTNDADEDYTHIDVSYAATDALSFTVSLPSDDGAGIQEEPLIMMSYSLPIGK